MGQSTEFIIGGITQFSTIDYPNHLAAVIYGQGCPLRCSYCHNTELQLFAKNLDTNIPTEYVMKWLTTRLGLLEGVVLSGGEPTAQRSVIPLASDIKKMGYDVGLHTSGISPFVLKELLTSLSWVGLDIKQLFTKYSAITGIESARNVKQSLELIAKSGIEFEIRTTYHPALISQNDLEDMAIILRDYGVKNWAIQMFRQTGCQDTLLRQAHNTAYPNIKKITQLIPNVFIRE